jgi:hypothetical protein
MKQLLSLFLFLVPFLAWAQYPSNGNQKITLGEQTTADGLIWRGVLSDTGIITPSSDTSAYIILDTVNHRFYNYNRATNVWSVAGGGTSVTTFSGGSTGLTPSTATSGAVTLGGTLAVANGGTNASTFTEGSVVFAGASGTYTQDNSNLFWDNTNKRLGIGTNTGVNTLTIKQASASMRIESTTGINFADFRIANTGGTLYYGISRSTGGIFGLEGAYEGLVFYGNTNQNNLMIATGGHLRFLTSNDNGSSYPERMRISSGGNVGIGQTTPTAVLHLKAGTATASTAPLKFTSGTNLTTAEAGAVEFNGTNLFFSPSTTRHTVNHGLTGSATLNFPSTTTLLSADLTITVTGAADGDVVSLGVPNAAVNANTSYSAWVSAANTVTVRFNNYSSGTVDPASALFKVFVTK